VVGRPGAAAMLDTLGVMRTLRGKMLLGYYA
jgi:hypothetical protein